jgi:hypothetical protein
MKRPRPIPRGNYRYRPKPKPPNYLRYDLILDGTVRVYPDCRQVCQDSRAGWREYDRRVEVMLQRQGFKCCLCPKTLRLSEATFEHTDPRGMGAAFRDDRIEDENGQPMNGAACWDCNGKKGSQRL